MEEGGAARYWLDRLFTAELLGVRLPADPQKMFVRSLVLQNSRFPLSLSPPFTPLQSTRKPTSKNNTQADIHTALTSIPSSRKTMPQAIAEL